MVDLIRSLRIPAAALALAIASAGASSALSGEVAGSAAILDGDTIQIGETRIRLVGIDAPETDQRCLDRAGKLWLCGIAAREAVSDLVANRPVRCQWSGMDIYRRMLATCWVAGENINRWLVRQGLALAYIKYSREFVEDEKQARDATRGMWSGVFIAPWDWRTRTRLTPLLGSGASGASLESLLTQEEAPPNPACSIKGNVNRKGERIFHVPGQHDYGRVNMKSPAKRWFCSEEEAIAAGWRKAMR
jgi:endonuclease YncB( thermonuclease family)